MNFDRLGTAQWADAEVIAGKYRHGKGKFWLGRTLPGNAPIGVIDDRHVCVVAGTRSGKGTSILIPNLLEWPGSAVVVDPTGDTASTTAAHRATELGQKVLVLDPYRESEVAEELRARFNPLDMLDPESRSVVRDAERIASALVSPDEKEEAWAQNGARRLITAIILYVISAPLLDGDRTLVAARELIYRGHTRMKDKWLSEGKNVQNASPFDILWSVMAVHEHANLELKDLVAGAGEEFDRMSRSAPAQWTGVHDVALSATNFINNRDMRECLSGSDFSLTEIKSAGDGVSVYLTVPSRDKVEDFRWLRLIISQIMSHMETQRTPPASSHDVLFMLDEFAALQKMDRIEAGIAEIAKYDVKLCIVLQNLGQLKRVYGDGWETFLANCGTKIFFGVDDKFTREYVSELIGETEIVRTTSATSQGTSTSSSRTDTTGSSKSEQESKSESKSDSYKRGKFNLRDTAGFFRKISGNASASDTKQSGSTFGTSTEESSSMGSTDSRESSSSRSEQIFKRPLVTPDEIGKLFQRVDDKTHGLYPGAAIVLLSDHPDPLMLRRQNFFDTMNQSSSFYEEGGKDAGKNGSSSKHPALKCEENDRVMEPTPGFVYPFNTEPEHLAYRAKIRETDIHKNGPDWHSGYVLDARFIPVASIPWISPDNPESPRQTAAGHIGSDVGSTIDWHKSVVNDAENYHERNCTIAMRVRGELVNLWNYLTDYAMLGHALDARLTSETGNERFEVGKRIASDSSVNGSDVIILSGGFRPNGFEIEISSPKDSDRDYEMFGWRRISATPLPGNEIKVEYTRLNYKKKRRFDFSQRRFLGYALTPDSVQREALEIALGYHAYNLFGENSVRDVAISEYGRGSYSKDGFDYYFQSDWAYAHEEVTYEYYPEVLQGTIFDRPFLAEAETPVAYPYYRNQSVDKCREKYSKSIFAGQEIVSQYVPNGARFPLFGFGSPTFLVRSRNSS